MKAQISDWSDIDWATLDQEVQKIQELCAQLNVWVTVGSAHKHPVMERPFNSLYVINNAGDIAARYDKRYCSNSEINSWYCAGSSPIVVEIEGITFGFAICIEIHFPEIFMEYGEIGADCVLFSAYHDAEMFKIQAQGHAASNNMWISYSVPANASEEQPSCFIGPDGTVVNSCTSGQPAFIVCEIDPDAKQWDIPCKKAKPWRKLARKGEIYRPFQLQKR